MSETTCPRSIEASIPFVETCYWLPNESGTSHQHLRKTSELGTSALEIEHGGLLLYLPDYDAMQVIRSAG